MADTLPSPPSSRSASPQALPSNLNKAASVTRLDELLVQYLELLDEYTTLREELSKTLSGGFMSLAHAQRTSNLGPGRRYGQDGYDERMKALKRTNIGLGEATNSPQLVQTDIPCSLEVISFDPRTLKPQSTLPQPQHTEANVGSYGNKQETVGVKDGLADVSASKPSEKTIPVSSSKKIDPAYRDPLTWFGILVPPPLRQAQKSFSQSVENTIPKLLSTTSALRVVEDKIWAIRAELGIADEFDKGKVQRVVVRPATTKASTSIPG